MARAEQGLGLYRSLAQLGRRRRAYVDAILAEVAERGPLTASELSSGGRGRGSWWGWSEGKTALEWLFWSGRVTTATRRRFERVYDLTERVLPPDVLSAPTPTEAEAHRSLVRLAARALGVATARDVRDYFRLDAADTKPRLAELVEAGELIPVRVEGWKDPAYLHRGRADPARRRRAGPALALRLAGLRAAAHRAPLRISLPDRDLHAGPPPRRTATTSSRSCWETGWSRASISRRTGPRACCASPPLTRKTGPTGAASRPRSSRSCAPWQRGSAWSASRPPRAAGCCGRGATRCSPHRSPSRPAPRSWLARPVRVRRSVGRHSGGRCPARAGHGGSGRGTRYAV